MHVRVVQIDVGHSGGYLPCSMSPTNSTVRCSNSEEILVRYHAIDGSGLAVIRAVLACEKVTDLSVGTWQSCDGAIQLIDKRHHAFGLQRKRTVDGQQFRSENIVIVHRERAGGSEEWRSVKCARDRSATCSHGSSGLLSHEEL